MYSPAKLDPGNFCWIVLLNWCFIRDSITGAYYTNYWLDRQETWVLFPEQAWTLWKVSYALLSLYFPMIMLFEKWFETFRLKILRECYTSVIKAALMTTSFPLTSFTALPREALLQHFPAVFSLWIVAGWARLLVCPYRSVLKVVHLNTGEKSRQCCKISCDLCSAHGQTNFASWLLQWHFLRDAAVCETSRQC